MEVTTRNTICLTENRVTDNCLKLPKQEQTLASHMNHQNPGTSRYVLDMTNGHLEISEILWEIVEGV